MPNIINLIRSVHSLEEKIKASKSKAEQLMTQRQRLVSTMTLNVLNNSSQLLKLTGKSIRRVRSRIEALITMISWPVFNRRYETYKEGERDEKLYRDCK
jgi:hypothetical protein